MQVDLDVHKHRVHHNCRFDTARFEEGKRRSRCRTLRMSHLTLLRRNAWIAASSSMNFNSSDCRLPPLSLQRAARRLLRNRQGGCLPSRNLSTGRSLRRIFEGGAFRRCIRLRASVFTHAATTSRATAHQRNLARTDRRRRRSQWRHYRYSPHLARSFRARQGADRHAAPRDGLSARQRGSLRGGG